MYLNVIRAFLLPVPSPSKNYKKNPIRILANISELKLIRNNLKCNFLKAFAYKEEKHWQI